MENERMIFKLYYPIQRYKFEVMTQHYSSVIPSCLGWEVLPLKSEVHLDADSAAVDAWDVAVVDAPHVVDT